MREITVGEKAIHRCARLIVKDGRWVRSEEDRDVIVMAIGGRYAMVRRPRAVPYVAPLKELICD